MVNGSSLNSFNSSNVQFSLLFEDSALGFLEVPLEYNGTSVQCTVLLLTGTQASSNIGTLLVQGNILAS